MAHLPFLAPGLETEDQQKEQDGHNGRDSPWGGSDVIGGKETGHNVQEAEEYSQGHGSLESLTELESGGHGRAIRELITRIPTIRMDTEMVAATRRENT